MLSKDTLTKLRAKLKLADDVKDEQVAEQAAALALADPPADLAPQVTALSAKVQTLEQERDSAKAKVLELSASAPRQPDDVTVAMFQENIDAKRETAIRAGAVSEAQAKVFDALLAGADGKPSTLALSACGTDRKPLAFRLWDAVAQLAEGKEGAIRTGNAVLRASAAPSPRHETYTGGGQENTEPVTPERKKEVLELAGYTGDVK